MPNREQYLEYAEECERLARNGPEAHREALLEIAKAWRRLAAKENPEKSHGD
jgi:hypothetical protein